MLDILSNSIGSELADASRFPSATHLCIPPVPPVHPAVGRLLTLQPGCHYEIGNRANVRIGSVMLAYPVTMRPTTYSPYLNLLAVMIVKYRQQESAYGSGYRNPLIDIQFLVVFVDLAPATGLAKEDHNYYVSFPSPNAKPTRAAFDRVNLIEYCLGSKVPIKYLLAVA